MKFPRPAASSSSLPRVLGYLCGTGTVGYTAYVAHDDWKRSRLRREDLTTFGVGSADDILSDYLQPGDVVLYRRRWFQHHLPMAACVTIYHLLHPTSEFDHCGVVVGLDKHGVPMMLELSPHGPPTVAPFPHRILQSKAQHIVLKPLAPRLNFTSEQLARAGEHIRTAAAHRSEFTAMLLGFAATAARMVMPTSPPLIAPECPSSHLVVGCWSALGIEPSSTHGSGSKNTYAVTCADLANGADALHLVYDGAPVPSGKQVQQQRPQQSVSLLGDVLIRTH